MEKEVRLDDVCDRKYIYLDWNVFKYIKEPRKDKEELDKDFKEIVIRTRRKYVYPFSEAHMRDRANNYKPEYRSCVEEDLSFAEAISEGYCLAYRPDKGWLQPIKQSITEVFDQVRLLQRATPLDLSAVYPEMFPVEVAKEDLENDELLTGTLSGEGDRIVWDRNKMIEFAERIFWECFDNNTTYERVRKKGWGKIKEEKNIALMMSITIALAIN